MKAVLVICEGRHDIIFVQRSLGAVAGCEWFGRPIKELPSPFGPMPPQSPKGLVKRRIEEREVDDLTLWAVADPPLPQFVSAVMDEGMQTLYMLIRANGKQQVDAVVDLLQDINASLGLGSRISRYATAFLFDANNEGLAATLEAFRNGYGEHFGDLSTADHAVWMEAPTCHVGVFVIHKSPSDPTGTLEDHLAPLVAAAWPGHFDAANAFIDDGRHTDETVSKSEAKRLKAIITSVGQFEHPGSPLSTLVDRDGIPTAQFETCKLSQELVRFLQAVPWQEPLEEPADVPQSA